MTYKSDELRYFNNVSHDTEGNVIETENREPMIVEKMAKCRRYEAESGWYGLMTNDGKVITPPSYYSITAISHDLYLCKDAHNEGVILNGKGERVR